MTRPAEESAVPVDSAAPLLLAPEEEEPRVELEPELALPPGGLRVEHFTAPTDAVPGSVATAAAEVFAAAGEQWRTRRAEN